LKKYTQRFVVEVGKDVDIDFYPSTLEKVVGILLRRGLNCKVKCTEIIGSLKIDGEALKNL